MVQICIQDELLRAKLAGDKDELLRARERQQKRIDDTREMLMRQRMLREEEEQLNRDRAQDSQMESIKEQLRMDEEERQRRIVQYRDRGISIYIQYTSTNSQTCGELIGAKNVYNQSLDSSSWQPRREFCTSY